MSLNSLPCMNQIVTANGLEVGIRQKCERVTGFLTEVARLLRTINADGNRTNPGFVKFAQPLLNAPQLGVAERSPIAAIENEQHTPGWFVIDRL